MGGDAGAGALRGALPQGEEQDAQQRLPHWCRPRFVRMAPAPFRVQGLQIRRRRTQVQPMVWDLRARCPGKPCSLHTAGAACMGPVRPAAAPLVPLPQVCQDGACATARAAPQLHISPLTSESSTPARACPSFHASRSERVPCALVRSLCMAQWDTPMVHCTRLSCPGTPRPVRTADVARMGPVRVCNPSLLGRAGPTGGPLPISGTAICQRCAPGWRE